MDRKSGIPESPKGKALSYLARDLPPGYHGPAEVSIRRAMQHFGRLNGGNVLFNYKDGTATVGTNGSQEVYRFSELVPDVEAYFDSLVGRH